MFVWLLENLGTITISIILVGIIATAIIVMKADKKKGKCSCGGSCGQCPMSGTCHKS